MNTRNRRVLASTVTAAALAAVVAGVAVAQPTSQPADNDTEVEEQDPMLNGSVQAPDDESTSEADEQAQLAQLDGLISEQDAIDAAVAAGGTSTSAELENENGSVIWEVEVTADDGTVEEVKVDAGNGDILDREADDDEADDDEAEDDDEIEHENEGDEGEHTDE